MPSIGSPARDRPSGLKGHRGLGTDLRSDTQKRCNDSLVDRVKVRFTSYILLGIDSGGLKGVGGLLGLEKINFHWTSRAFYYNSLKFLNCRELAQLVERHPYKVDVVGSSPAFPTK